MGRRGRDIITILCLSWGGGRLVCWANTWRGKASCFMGRFRGAWNGRSRRRPRWWRRTRMQGWRFLRLSFTMPGGSLIWTTSIGRWHRGCARRMRRLSGSMRPCGSRRGRVRRRRFIDAGHLATARLWRLGCTISFRMKESRGQRFKRGLLRLLCRPRMSISRCSLRRRRRLFGRAGPWTFTIHARCGLPACCIMLPLPCCACAATRFSFSA